MKIEYSTKFNVGDKLYYLSGMEIKETFIRGILLSLKFGDVCNSSPELVYLIANSHNPCIGDEALQARYYLSKEELAKAIVAQI